MNQQTKQCKTCYLTINQLCDKINETIKLEYDNDSKAGPGFACEKHKFKPYTADLYIMIISNDNIYNDRYNKLCFVLFVDSFCKRKNVKMICYK